MAKTDVTKVNPDMAEIAVNRAKSRNAVYSECVRLSFQTTGKLGCGFDNKDLQAWIDMFMPEVFDEKGNKKESTL
jgi:hypothetical protein